MAKKKSLISTAEREQLRKLGLRIRKARNAKGWTLEDVEEQGYNNWQHWQAIENGKKNINFTTLLRIAKVLKTTSAVLLKGI